MANGEELFLISQTVKEDILTNSVDLTLQLPDHLLHSIFSCLNFHDLLHVRLLINAEKRALRVQFNDRGDIHDIMKLLDGNEFHEVYLRIQSLVVQHICYYLPYIFQSKCLTILHLTTCELEKHVLLCGEEIIPSLQELKLDGVTLSEEILSKFISKCPNIRELSLIYFHSFTSIQVVAPSLQVFHFILLSIHSCKMLQEFHLDCWKFPNGLDPDNFCSDFTHLELCSSLRKWMLSFPQLYECSRRSIDSSPNLSSFQYKGTTFQPYLAPPSEVLENINNIVLVPKVREIMNRAWFHKLRSHLDNFSNYNTTLDLCVREEPSGRAPTQPLHHIKHLMVDMNKLKYQQEYLMEYIIDNLLWMSHPNTLTLSIPTNFSPTAYEVSKKLFGRGDRNCCSGTQDKCWQEKEKFDVLTFHYVPPVMVKCDSDEKKDKLIFAFTWKLNR
ncbi:hypothetical protein R3W88_010190 [Solanum pinnatisectum]|uniref:F-box domain-containing protein n=1 Tax=Solanum pinnatisectum TaxID=50273 RepID=A0AAV9MFS3_9SOLN|nr:hypothetical protein R3W88_010190 [Solanum pinnatisectum]